LRDKNIEIEFADPDVAVMMIAPENRDYGLITLFEALLAIPKRAELPSASPKISALERVISIRKATLSASEAVSVDESVGRVLASATVSCPPAVPIAVSGERIDETAVNAFKYYGIDKISVLKHI